MLKKLGSGRNYYTATGGLFAIVLWLTPNHLPAQSEFTDKIAPFLAKFCADCHGKDVQEANFTVHDLKGKVSSGSELERWEKIHEMLSLAQMPPSDADQPGRARRSQVVKWITSKLEKIGRAPDPLRLQLPQFGNRVSHDELFNGKHQGPAFSYARIWRVSPEIFAQTIKDNGITRTPCSGLGGCHGGCFRAVGRKRHSGFRNPPGG